MNDTELLTEILGAVRELAERVERIEAIVRENCNAAKILTSRRERHRVYMANLRSTTKDVNSQQCVISQKEKEAEIRELPPTPPIENKGEEKEKAAGPYIAGARARRVESHPGESLAINVTPTLETVLQYAKDHNICSEEHARRWYDYETNEAFWLDSKTGDPIKNWVTSMAHFTRILRKEDEAKAEKEKRNRQRDEEHERKMAYYAPRQRTANNQPEGVVLKRKDYHARF